MCLRTLRQRFPRVARVFLRTGYAAPPGPFLSASSSWMKFGDGKRTHSPPPPPVQPGGCLDILREIETPPPVLCSHPWGNLSWAETWHFPWRGKAAAGHHCLLAPWAPQLPSSPPPSPPIGVLAVERQSPGRPPGARWPSTHACPWDSVLPVGAPVLPRQLPGTPLPQEPMVGGCLHTGRGPSAAPGAAGPGLRFWEDWKQRGGGVGRPGAPQPGSPSVLRERFSGGINVRNTMPVGKEVVRPRCRGGGGQGSQGPPGRAAHLPGGPAGAGGRGAALSPVRSGQSRAGPPSPRLRGWSRIGPRRTFAVSRVPTPVPKIPARLLGEPWGAAVSQIGGLGCRPVCTTGFPAPPRPAPSSSRQPGSAGVCCGRSPVVALRTINLKRAESAYIEVLFCGAEATLLPEIHFYGSIRG